MPDTPRKNRSRLAAMLSDLTGFPVESLSDIPVLLCKGSCEMLAEGCRSILEYSENRIRLDMGKETLVIEGEKLTMSDFHRDTLTIRGSICSIRWEV